MSGVIRTDNVKATKTGAIRSAKFYVSTTATKIDNGNLVQVDVLLDASANREIYKAITPANLTDKNIGVVATPEIIYDETTKAGGSLQNFENAAGSNITVLILEAGDVLSVSDECITAIDDTDDVPAVGSYVTNTAGSTKWTEKATLGGTESVVGKIIARELYKKDCYLNVVEIVSAN
jgi:hypothetical protein